MSPSVLFVAARDQGFAASVPRSKHTDVVKMLNKAVVSQARKFVWATDDSQLEFVRHIGKAPDRTIITKEQKEASLAAARGEFVVENPADQHRADSSASSCERSGRMPSCASILR